MTARDALPALARPILSGEGETLIDVDGRRIVDLASGHLASAFLTSSTRCVHRPLSWACLTG